MNKYLFLPFCLLLLFFHQSKAQDHSLDSTKILNNISDSIYIAETESVKGKDKVFHAEPLYIDLIRDLGARKGESELNVGYGVTDYRAFTQYEGLIEYEYAIFNRLGVEVEVPFSYYSIISNNALDKMPLDRINGLKLATQYTYFVSEKLKTSLAIGYIHEFEMPELQKLNRTNVYKGNVFNPFLIGAKRWGNHFHTLIYTGPQIEQEWKKNSPLLRYDINSNFHYMIPGTRNFIGLEINKEFSQYGYSMKFRPQLRLGITDRMLIGIVTGIPTNIKREGISTFFRLIYEPKNKKLNHT